jgi:hypothetical protein
VAKHLFVFLVIFVVKILCLCYFEWKYLLRFFFIFCVIVCLRLWCSGLERIFHYCYNKCKLIKPFLLWKILYSILEPLLMTICVLPETPFFMSSLIHKHTKKNINLDTPNSFLLPKFSVFYIETHYWSVYMVIRRPTNLLGTRHWWCRVWPYDDEIHIVRPWSPSPLK